MDEKMKEMGIRAKHAAGVLATLTTDCLLYTSDAADERSSVDLGGRRIIKKKKSAELRRVELVKMKNTEEVRE